MRAHRGPLLAAAALALAAPAAAVGQLGLPLPPLPDPIQTVTQTTDPITGSLPDPLAGTVDTVTGTVGGVVNTVDDTTGGATGGITDTVGQTVDQVLGGTLGELPTGTIDGLLGAAGLNGLNGANGQPGVTVMPDGTVVVDKRAPVTKVTVLNRNRTVGRSGKVSLRISSDEPSVVALLGSVKPGRAWRLHGKAARRHLSKAIRIPKVVLAYRRAGSLKLTIQFSSRAQRTIRQSYNSTIRMTLVAVDVARNQVTRKLTRVVKH
jgi:hypothetical protein